jgi:thymidine phosphorylase
MLPQEIIRHKRDGLTLSREEIDFMVQGIASGDVVDSQVGAFAMATFFQGMTMAERVDLTRAMTHSGLVVDWSAENLQGPCVDKHSTGGVGDKVSLMLAPIVAACGGYVPMISGRGLGHTGGTLDKLDSIPGFQTVPDMMRFKKTVKDVGCSIIGQTPELAPADRRFYAIRDVTATVESVPIITASILSKKLAAGLDALVMDVKTGNGAFADNTDMAIELADSILAVAQGAGLPCAAIVTDMNTVLGHSAGNALEVMESIDFLTGVNVDPRLYECTVALCAEMVHLAKLTSTHAEARQQVENVIANGRAAEIFAEMVVAQGGPADLLERPEAYFDAAAVVYPVAAPRSGVVQRMNVRDLGLAVVEMGGGRRTPTDTINPVVGLSRVLAVGDEVQEGEPLMFVHAASLEDAEKAQQQIFAAITIADKGDVLPVCLETRRQVA